MRSETAAFELTKAPKAAVGSSGKSTKSPIFNFLINGRILFSVLDGANKKVRGWATYGRSAHYVSDP